VGYAAICKWLVDEYRFDVRSGVYGMPKDERLMQASAKCLGQGEGEVGDG